MSNVLARARSYIERLPGAVSGDRGHDTTLTVACTCVRFDLTEEEAMGLLREYNQRCSPPWSEKELLHKLRSAQTKAAAERGAMAAGNGHSRVAAQASATAQPWRPVSPGPAAVTPQPTPRAVCAAPAAMDLPEPIERGAVELLRHLYSPDEHVRIVQGCIDERDGREKPADSGLTLPVREWLARASARKDDLASLWSSSSGAGVYIGMNPMRAGGTRDEDVTAYRFALLESDQIPQEEQFGAITASKVPCAAVIDSGGKSIHAWVRVDARDRREYEERVGFLRTYFPWADPKNVNPSRMSRLPDARRRGGRQRLLQLKVGCGSWSEWMAEVSRQSLGPARSFADLCALDTTRDPNCVIGFRDGATLRYLCRGKAAWLLGPSGTGKSSLEAQFAVGWAIGAPVFGIAPARPLRSLIIQAENDDYDLAEMVQGVASAHGLHPEDERWADVARNVLFRTETSSFGARFCGRLREMIDADRPDVVWVDPLLSFAGIDVSKQDQVTPFLRELLTPVLESTGTVMIGVHHTGKPKDSKATRDWTAIDWAYAGIGSSELVNWARAVMLLRPVDGRDYELKLAKRGTRAGATHPDGSVAHSSVWLRQAVGRIYWEHCQPPEEPASAAEEPSERSRRRPAAQGEPRTAGRPSKVDQALALEWLPFTSTLPADGVSGRELHELATPWMAKTGGIGVGKSAFLESLAPKLVQTNRLQMSGGRYYAPHSDTVRKSEPVSGNPNPPEFPDSTRSVSGNTLPPPL